MSAMTDAFETSLLNLLFKNTALSHVGDATGLPVSASAGSTQISLNSSALSDTSTVITAGELTYTGYSRPTQVRGAGWTVSGTSPTVATNAGLIQFGEMTAGGPVTATYCGLSFSSASANVRCDLWAQLTSGLVINNGVNPQFAIGAISWSAA
jgi:hypothetical protein